MVACESFGILWTQETMMRFREPVAYKSFGGPLIEMEYFGSSGGSSTHYKTSPGTGSPSQAYRDREARVEAAANTGLAWGGLLGNLFGPGAAIIGGAGGYYGERRAAQVKEGYHGIRGGKGSRLDR
jgi:hypothetical protein